MTSPAPQPAVSKSGGFQTESGIFTNFNDLYRFFQPRIMKVSKQSPPVLNVDVHEGEIVWDRTANRLYTCSNQTLRFVQFT
jgi:hypothetical protein